MSYFSALTQQAIQGDDIMLSGICLDSRKIQKGDLFCAIKGADVDGHLYIQEALSRGASAIAMQSTEFAQSIHVPYIVDEELSENLGAMAAEFYNNPTEKIHVVGVTGTNGKSSVSSYCKQLFSLLGEHSAEIGTLGMHYLDSKSHWQKIETTNTTPDAISLQAGFSMMHEEKVTSVVMEVSSHALKQGRCKSTNFDAAVFTNLTQDHLDYHETMNAYAQAKLSLFTDFSIRHAVVNIDDPYSATILASLSEGVTVTSYSLANISSDLFFSEIELSAAGTKAILNYQEQAFTCDFSLVGRFNCYNILATIAVALDKGFSLKDILQKIALLNAVDGRMQFVNNKKGVSALVDYAHTADALENVLKTLAEFKSANLVLVFGCGGDRDRSKRAEMAKVAELYADTIIVTADNPRAESLASINEDINSGFTQDNILFIDDRRAAIEAAVTIANEHDVLLVAGKGHEKFQLINNEKIPFDDVHVLEQCFMRTAS